MFTCGYERLGGGGEKELNLEVYDWWRGGAPKGEGYLEIGRKDCVEGGLMSGGGSVPIRGFCD